MRTEELGPKVRAFRRLSWAVREDLPIIAALRLRSSHRLAGGLSRVLR